MTGRIGKSKLAIWAALSALASLGTGRIGKKPPTEPSERDEWNAGVERRKAERQLRRNAKAAPAPSTTAKAAPVEGTAAYVEDWSDGEEPQ